MCESLKCALAGMLGPMQFASTERFKDDGNPQARDGVSWIIQGFVKGSGITKGVRSRTLRYRNLDSSETRTTVHD